MRQPAIRAYAPRSGITDSWPMPALVGGIARGVEGSLLVASGHDILIFDPRSGTLAQLVAVGHADSAWRFNEFKPDRQGRVWFGRMNDVTRLPVGSLVRFDRGVLTPAVHGVAVPNSLCWSLDGRTMYFSDGIRPAIWAYPVDPESAEIGERRLFAELSPGEGIPDGATIDAEGYLWSARYGGGALARYAPDGRVDRVVRLPVSQPTNCAFGGPDLDVLYITTASQRLSDEARRTEPLAGRLLTLRPGVTGIEEPIAGTVDPEHTRGASDAR